MLERSVTSRYKEQFSFMIMISKKKKKKKVKTVKMCIILKRVFSVIRDHLLPLL